MTDEDRTLVAVRSWLQGQGYPLEMQVAREFHAAGFNVQQSDYYTTNEGTSREIDVSARLLELFSVPGVRGLGDDADAAGSVVFEMFVIAECKSGPKSQKPWIVFSSTHNALPSVRFDLMGTTLGRRAMAKAIHKDAELQSHELFAQPERYGYALSCAFVKPEALPDAGREPKAKGEGGPRETAKVDGFDPGYAALMSLASAARSRAGKTVNRELRMCNITLPILVVSTPLVECWLDEDSELQLAHRDSMTIAWRNPVAKKRQILIEVIRERALPDYIQKVRDVFTWMVEHHEDTIAAAVVEHESSSVTLD